MLVPALYGQAFGGSVPALWVLLIGIALFPPVTIVAAYFGGSGRPSVNARISAAALAVTLIGDLTLIPTFGIVGAAAASSVSYATSLALTLVLAGRDSGLGPRALLVPTLADVRRVRRVLHLPGEEHRP